MNNTHLPSHLLSTLLSSPRRLYFVGIGGVSMTGLAYLARARGHTVSGCDRDTTSPRIDRLRLDGFIVEDEATADPRGGEIIVYTLAVQPSSPAIVRAHTYGLTLLSRADLLAALTITYPHLIAVAGMHGKSTTVGMLSAILTRAGLDPTVLSGAPLTPKGDAHRIGEGDICLVEACEYRDSFLSLRPTLGVVTNIELDHPDYFADLAAVKRSFSLFLNNCTRAIVGGDCAPLHALAPPALPRFGFHANCEIRGSITQDGLCVSRCGEPLGPLSLGVAGDYNRENALGATAAALSLGVSYPVIVDALASFRGVGRRMESVGTLAVGGGTAAVYLDYAHHPTELTAAVTAAREWGGRVIAVFQPHTYTRTRALWDDFITALRLPDFTILTDIYAAREAAIDGTSSLLLARAAGVAYAPLFPAAAALLRDVARPGDTILILGAGDIDRLLPYLLSEK